MEVIQKKEKFNSKLYYLNNKEKILKYNRIYFKDYYKRLKLGKHKKETNFKLIIERNVRVTF